VTEELLVNRRAEQVGAPEGRAVLPQQRQRILGELAITHLLNADEPANLLSWNAAVEIVQSIMRCDRSAAEAHLRVISRDTGLITVEKRTKPKDLFI
jgi:hypothetical protein